ncbi:hypothetical protein N7530_006020, partial [Penicillium desertorum]
SRPTVKSIIRFDNIRAITIKPSGSDSLYIYYINFNSVILSLYTFFKDFKYLEAYTYYIKRLYENYKCNIYSTLRKGNRDFRGIGFLYLDLRVYFPTLASN